MKKIKIKFTKPLTTLFNGWDAIEVIYPFIITEGDNEYKRNVKIAITGSKAREWGFDSFNNQSRSSANLINALFFYVRPQVIDLIRNNRIGDLELVIQLLGISYSKNNFEYPDVSNFENIEGLEIVIEIEDSVKDYLASNKIYELFQIYESKNSGTHDLVLLKSRFNKLESDRQENLISDNDYRVEYSKIIKSLLDNSNLAFN